MAEPAPGKIVLKTEPLQKCILNVSTFGREHEQLKKLREATFQKYGMRAGMGVPPDEGLFLSILLKAMDAKKTLEIGVFTGYSLLTTALALRYNGQVCSASRVGHFFISISLWVLLIDRSPNYRSIVDRCHRTGINKTPEFRNFWYFLNVDKRLNIMVLIFYGEKKLAYEVGLPFIREAGVEHKINFIQSEAFPALDEMLKKGEEFDFVFVNADTRDYKKYHEQLIEMVKLGGMIAYQNTILCYGSVAGDEEVKDVPCYISLASDPRIEISPLSIANGVTLCMRML